MSEIPIEEGGQFNPLYPEDKGFNHIVISPTANNTSNDFRPPCLNKISSSIKGGGKSILVLYATPTLPGYCRHIGASIVIQPEKTEGDKAKSIVGGVYGLPLPAWFLHVAASFFLHQDQVFLHHQERMLYASSQYAFGRFNGGDLSSTQGQGLGEAKYNLTSDPKAYASTYFMPNEMDSQITTFRNWISTKANGGPQWGKTALARGLPPRLPSAQLFDVWDAHTKNCATCQQALKNIIKIRNSSMVLAAIAAIIMRGKYPCLSRIIPTHRYSIPTIKIPNSRPCAICIIPTPSFHYSNHTQIINLSNPYYPTILTLSLSSKYTQIIFRTPTYQQGPLLYSNHTQIIYCT